MIPTGRTLHSQKDSAKDGRSCSLTNKAREQADRQDGDASWIRRWFCAWERFISRPGLDFEEIRKRKLFAILILPGICISFSFAIYHMYHANLVEGISDLAVAVWLVLTLVAFRVTKIGAKIYRINAALIGCLFLFLSVKGGIHGHKLMWSFSFPLIAFYTLGRREGSFSTALLYVLIIGILYLPLNFIRVHMYAPEVKLRFCVAFFLVASLTHIYEWVRENIQNNLEGERNKLEIEKSKLAELSDTLQKVNQALTLSEQRMARAQVIARVGNLEYKIFSGMLWGSEEAFRILGVVRQRPEFPLSVLKRIIPEFDVFRHEFEDCMRNNREYDKELTVRRLSDGESVVLHVMAEVVRNKTGKAEKIISILQDITEQKKAERDKLELENKLARSQKMEALGILAGGVAHDLNNVLSGVVGYPDLLLRNLPPESSLIRPLKIIQESGQKAAAIVQDLLTLARRGVTNHKILNLNDLVVEYMASPEHRDIQGWHPGVTFEIDLDPALLNIKGSTVHLKKTIMNLVSNAAEALLEGGHVRIHSENRYVDAVAKGFSDVPEGEYAVLHIEDNGIGISPEDLGRIFEPFYTKKKMGRSGTGLGMAVVWGAVQDHRGYIHIDSSEGIGTRISLYFPVTRQPVSEQKKVVPLEEYTGQGEIILVVDDVAEQRELAQNMLSTLGYRVHTATGGEAALEFLIGQSVDLVILDMIMDPGIDGLETYIRILEIRPDQRAIIVSGFSETERVREAQRHGARAYVKKPYTLENLGIAVRCGLSP